METSVSIWPWGILTGPSRNGSTCVINGDLGVALAVALNSAASDYRLSNKRVLLWFADSPRNRIVSEITSVLGSDTHTQEELFDVSVWSRVFIYGAEDMHEAHSLEEEIKRTNPDVVYTDQMDLPQVTAHVIFVYNGRAFTEGLRISADNVLYVTEGVDNQHLVDVAKSRESILEAFSIDSIDGAVTVLARSRLKELRL